MTWLHGLLKDEQWQNLNFFFNLVLTCQAKAVIPVKNVMSKTKMPSFFFEGVSCYKVTYPLCFKGSL